MPRTKGAFSTFDEQERLDLYNSGKLDNEIAQELGYNKNTIYWWRRRRGLPANGGSGWGGLRVNHKRHNIERRVALCEH